MDGKAGLKKKNVAIELWRFLIAIAIIGFHVGWIIARTCDGSNGFWMQSSNWFFGSSEVLLIFTVTAGFFMAAHFTKRKGDAAYMARSASSRAMPICRSERVTARSSSRSSVCRSAASFPSSTVT